MENHILQIHVKKTNQCKKITSVGNQGPSSLLSWYSLAATGNPPQSLKSTPRCYSTIFLHDPFFSTWSSSQWQISEYQQTILFTFFSKTVLTVLKDPNTDVNLSGQLIVSSLLQETASSCLVFCLLNNPCETLAFDYMAAYCP